jgi:hypothetical protein
MAEYRRSDRPADKAYEKDCEGFEHSDYRVRFGEEELAEDQPGDLAVKQEIVPLNRRTDRASDERATQLRAVLGVGQRRSTKFDCGHLGVPPNSIFRRADR